MAINLLLLIFLLQTNTSVSLHLSQSQSLIKIHELLNYYPFEWTASTDFCNTEPNLLSTVVCYEGNVTQLHISGTFNHFLPQNFTAGSLFDAIEPLQNLKVLSLVSLGLWGTLPGNIGALSSLEILNLSFNYFNGGIPYNISRLKNLQTLILDHNLFTGNLPHWIGSETLPVLSVLSLRDNSLHGCLPRTLSFMQNLRILAVSNNRFYGEIPDLRRLSNLQILDMEGNLLGPTFPKLCNKVVDIVLKRNKFRQNLPPNLTSFYQLRKLDVSLNTFTGPFDPKLLSIPSLTYIDISQNKLTGLLLENMTSCNPELMFVNLSSNLLTGDLPECLQSKNVSFSDNCLSSSRYSEQFPRSFCRIAALAVEIPLLHRRYHPRRRGVGAVVLSVIGAVSVGLAMLWLLFVISNRLYRTKKVMEPKTRWITEKFSTADTAKQLLDAKNITEMLKLGPRRLPAYRVFSLEELREAVNSFDAAVLLGEVSHEQVCRGRFADGTVVCIRTLQMKKKQNAQSYTHHFEILAKLRHCHLVSALGHCLESCADESSISRIHLVFENASNGTLRSSISGNTGQKLSWGLRMSAAIGITKGMQFLHAGFAPHINSNLKIDDMLLDQDFRVKISNYNLAMFDDTSNNIKSVRSANNNRTNNDKCPPRMLRMKKNGEECDVYKFGMILMEMITGRPIESEDDADVSRDILEASLKSDERARRSILDPTIQKDPIDESLKTLMSLCIKCLSTEADHRPSVEDVLWNLQFAAQIEECWKASSPAVSRISGDRINSQRSF